MHNQTPPRASWDRALDDSRPSKLLRAIRIGRTCLRTADAGIGGPNEIGVCLATQPPLLPVPLQPLPGRCRC